MRALFTLFILSFAWASAAAPNFNKLSYEELRSFDTSTLDQKEQKKYDKAWAKVVKKREKIIDKARKKHEKEEKKRISALTKSPEVSVFNNTNIAQSEFDPAPVAKGPEWILEGRFFLAAAGFPGIKYFMRSSGNDQFDIYVIDSYGSEWKNWTSARLSGGADANLTSLSRNQLRCEEPLDCYYKEEHFTLTLSSRYLSDWYEAGGGDLRVEIRGGGENHKQVLEFHEEYLYGYIDKINDEFNIVEPSTITNRRAELERALEPRPFVITEDLFQ